MTATDTYLLLHAFCDELARCGLRHACTSPGSRCTPIVLSLEREPRIRCWSHIDERCAAFFALGAARASGRPVATVCTSGTAAANFSPAVIEAKWARVPLIVLTADRPPELRDIGAGQTIDQLKLYGDAVKWFFEVGVHEASTERLRWIRALACRAYWTALGPAPGPVHLNLPLPEPLVLDAPLPEDTGGRSDGRPWITRPPAPRTGRAATDALTLELPARGVVVAGRAEGDDPAAGAAVAEFAARAGYPLLADPLSGARRGVAAIAHYDLLLREPGFAHGVKPDLVLRVGDLPTSKALRGWLGSLDAVRQVALDSDQTWHDPAAVVEQRLAVEPTVLERLAPAQPSDSGWLDAWRHADEAAAAALRGALEEELSEPAVARELGRSLGAQTPLFVASSMPIRDLESFMEAGAGNPRVLANRGANGIDGTVSCAFGVAAASGRHVVALIGDVALAHDIGGLLSARRLGLALTIVLLNNDGGGIFHFLPVAAEGEAFERHVATPHGLPFARAAQLFGCHYEVAHHLDGLRAALGRALATPATTIVEVPTDREQNFSLHRRLQAAVAEVLRPRERSASSTR